MLENMLWGREFADMEDVEFPKFLILGGKNGRNW